MIKIPFKFPIDIVLCLLCSIILLLVALLDAEGYMRIVLGLPLILFIPGYLLIFALFPNGKPNKGIDIMERIALSFGLSIAIVSLIGLALNYTTWGIRFESVLTIIFIFIFFTGIVAIYRWIKAKSDERYTINFNLSLLQSKNKLDKSLNIVLVVFIVIILVLLVYVIVIPKTGEQFTEFYILGPSEIAENYPTYLLSGEKNSVILGIVNHEGQTINYTVEIWLIDQTTVFNETTQENESVYNHMWFTDKITVMLNHTPADIEKRWEPQWEYNYTFAINKTGENLKLQFLLFKVPTEEYNQYDDYLDLADEKINSAYRETHLWITVF